MDYQRIDIAPLRELAELVLKPIVKDVVDEALLKFKMENKEGQRFIPVKQVTEEYGVSQSCLYLRFRTGKLKRHKYGGLTFVDRVELEQGMKTEVLCGKKPFKKK